MSKRIASLLMISLLLTPIAGLAKGKKQTTLPAYVLQAHTVAVIIDPASGIDLEHPDANKIAQKDVETALLNWGRLDPQMSTEDADLIIVVRKGSGRLVQDTVADPRQNNRPGVINPTSNGISIGAQHGPQPAIADASNGQNTGPHTQAETSQRDDTFVVFQGGVDNPLDASPAWRYTAKNGLHSHDVPAVDAFRNAIAEAEKAAGAHP
jgi:hypothetical protein